MSIGSNDSRAVAYSVLVGADPLRPDERDFTPSTLGISSGDTEAEFRSDTVITADCELITDTT